MPTHPELPSDPQPFGPEIAVVVPTRDRPGPLAACLAALEEQTGDLFEVVVVDDGSVDAEAVAAVVAAAPHARLVRGVGQGPAAARNRGAATTTAPVLGFIDDDCRAGPGWLEALTRRIQAGAQVVAGPTINGRPADGFARASQTVTNHLVEAEHDASTGRVEFAPTSNLACRAEVHRSLSFDEAYPLAAGEDRDWCARLANRGIPLQLEPAARVFHHQDLSLRAFWRQQVRYGRGAHRYRRNRPQAGGLQPLRFYGDLLRKGFAQGVSTGLLVILAQVATAVGIAREAVARRRAQTQTTG